VEPAGLAFFEEVKVETIKQQALKLLSQLPDDCSWEDILAEIRQKSASNSRATRDEDNLPLLKEFIAKLTKVLQDKFPAPTEIHIKPAPDGERVKGFLVSESFANTDDADRQDELWDILEDNFSPSEQRRVLSILAFTPEEYRAYREEE
jgi:acid stress-induced BolA-like protein IbaG/YrbA